MTGTTTTTVVGTVEETVTEVDTTEYDSRKIVRTRDAGVFFAEVYEADLATGTAMLSDARRLWYWDGAATLSQLAVDGTSKPTRCKFPVAVTTVAVAGVIEIITVTAKAGASIDSVHVWEA